MISPNNSIRSHQGSALIVTILLVSVLLATALILLQRIIPYAKSVRSMHDASQAYYVARGQVDMARLEFFYGGDTSYTSMKIPTLFGFLSQTSSSLPEVVPSTKRGSVYKKINNIKQIEFTGNPGSKTASPVIPFSLGASKTTHRDRLVSSTSIELPLRVKPFPTDGITAIKNFGTSKTNSLYHTLSSRNSGGLRFDLRGVDTDDVNFSLSIAGPTTGTVILKMQYYAGGTDDVKTFTGEYDLSDPDPTKRIFTAPTGSATGNIQSIHYNSTISSSTSTFHDFLNNLTDPVDCSTATICSVSLILKSATNQSIDFQLISSAQIPDLNAVAIGDGLSGNGLFYQRIIDLIPTPQDI